MTFKKKQKKSSKVLKTFENIMENGAFASKEQNAPFSIIFSNAPFSIIFSNVFQRRYYGAGVSSVNTSIGLERK